MAITDDFLARSREAQRIAPAPLAGVSASKRGAHPRWRVSRQANVGPTLRAQCVHMPHTGCAAAYVRSGYCLRVSTCWVCPCARCSCAVVTLARLGVTIFVSWLGVRCRAVTRPGLARLFCTDLLHFRRCCLRARWSLYTRVHALGVFLCKVFLRCRDTRSAWRDDFCQLAWGAVRSSDSTWSGSAFFAPLSWAPAVAVSVVYPSLLQLRWFTRACSSGKTLSQWPSRLL